MEMWSRLNKRLALIGVFLTAVFLLSCVILPVKRGEAKTADQVRIVFVTHGATVEPYWSSVKLGLTEAAEKMGSKVEYFAPDTFDVVTMQKLMDTAVASQPDGLVVTVPDLQAIGPSVKKASESGIPVIIIDTGEDNVAELGARFYVGSGSLKQSGIDVGKRFKAQGVTRGVCINHEVGNASNDEACVGFNEGLEGNSEVLPVTSDPTDVRSRVQAYFTSHPETTGAFALGPGAAVATLEGLRQADMLGKIRFGTFNLAPEVLDAIQKKEMDFAIDFQQYLMGYLPVVFLTLNSLYGTMPTANVYTGPAFVTAADAALVTDLVKKGIR
jgi:simple sugar transport system substrate-binding protein